MRLVVTLARLLVVSARRVQRVLHLLVVLVLDELVVQNVVVAPCLDLLVEQTQSVLQHVVSVSQTQSVLKQVVSRLVSVHRHQPTIVQT